MPAARAGEGGGNGGGQRQGLALRHKTKDENQEQASAGETARPRIAGGIETVTLEDDGDHAEHQD